MGEVFFIDKEGNRISSENIESHIGLANMIIENNEELKQKYEESGKGDVVDFLIENGGFIKVNNIYMYKTLEYFGPNTSVTQRKYIMAYYDLGYKITDLAKFKAKTNDDDEGR